MRIAVYLLTFLTSLQATCLAAGPWPRDVKTVFLSNSIERDRQSNSYSSLYGEYGVSVRTTFGFELGHSGAGETTGLFWLQRALDQGDGPDRWSLSLGAGALTRGEAVVPLGQIGLAWGRGWSDVPGLRGLPKDGWVALETRIRIAGERRDDLEIATRVQNGDGFLAYITPETTTKADLTIGWNATDKTIVMGQIRLENRADAGFFSKVAASVVHDFGPVSIDAGLFLPTSGLGEPAIRLGGWFRF